MSAARTLSGITATGLIARLTFTRFLRSRSLWISAFLAALPVVYAALVLDGDSPDAGMNEVFGLVLGLLAIVPPLHLAPAVGEEIEDHTFTYLWSRPLPRWSLVVGKLVALVPPLALLLAIGFGLAMELAYGLSTPGAGEALARNLSAIAAGVGVAGCVSVGIGSLLPRQAMATSIAYLLLLDLPVGAIPFSLQNLALSYHVRQLAAVDADAGRSLLWLAGIAAIWLIVAFWRITVSELSTER